MIFALSGFLLFQVSGQPPHGEASVPFMIGATLYGMAFALCGGYVGGLVAGRRPLVHATAVAALLALVAAMSLISTLGKGAIWSQVCALVLMAPSAVVGGWLRERSVRTAQIPTHTDESLQV
jgi:hypothetical protein